ncbi:hypothetical protein [Flavobacterium frigidarium]|jgi:hypothetical protein|uniref:HNH endonuclease n=1 Tax=Flavobacterium frigidarium TaxID=99286 RepID=A0ABV4KHT5_9FLAO
MLKPLVYKYHQISKFQSFINYLFLEVVFNNDVLEKNDSYSNDLLIDKYKNILNNVSNEHVYDSLVIIYNICKYLKKVEIKLLRRAVHNNNKIELLCSGKETPITYREINKIDNDLSIELKKIFGRLYKYVINLQPVYSKYGKKDEFYKLIIDTETVCHCCGVGTMLNIYQGPVGALDHYFPINHYPFTSINFVNLMPICDICNSKYKTQKDTLFLFKTKTKFGIKRTSIRRYKAFFPYSNEYELINVSVQINNNDLNNLSENDISIDYLLENKDEEILNWERLFKVSETHKANLLGNESREYINQQFDIINGLGVDFNTYFNLINNNLFYDKNFIRLPYLREFNRITSR